MARLIDADALKVKAFADPDSGEGVVYVQDIDEAQTVDAVEVVRCKDCKNQVGMWCWRKQEDHTHFRVGSDDFCFYGERRTDG